MMIAWNKSYYRMVKSFYINVEFITQRVIFNELKSPITYIITIINNNYTNRITVSTAHCYLF
jgi:hypothetical protein